MEYNDQVLLLYDLIATTMETQKLDADDAVQWISDNLQDALDDYKMDHGLE